MYLNTFLYKYMSMDNIDRVEQIFKENKFYFQSPNSFNDPFDCKALIDCNYSDKDDFSLFHSRIIRTLYPEISESELDNKIQEALSEKKFPEIINSSLKNVLYQLNEILGVFCLSEIHDDILMWSHYANSHKGIVLQFDSGSLLKTFRHLNKVEYSKNYLPLKYWNDYFDKPNEMFKLLLCRKSEHWNYEKEWRIIQPIGDDRNLLFPKDILTGVIIGCNASDDVKEQINKWIKDYKLETKIYFALKNDEGFSLEIQTETESIVPRKRFVVFEEDKKWFKLGYELNSYCHTIVPVIAKHDNDNQKVSLAFLYIRLLAFFQAILLFAEKNMLLSARAQMLFLMDTLFLICSIVKNPQISKNYLYAEELIKLDQVKLIQNSPTLLSNYLEIIKQTEYELITAIKDKEEFFSRNAISLLTNEEAAKKTDYYDLYVSEYLLLKSLVYYDKNDLQLHTSSHDSIEDNSLIHKDFERLLKNSSFYVITAIEELAKVYSLNEDSLKIFKDTF